MKVNALVWAAVAAMVVGVVGCGGDDKKADAAPQPADTAAATAAPVDTGAAPAATAAPAQ
jgi:hypothetical protein